jgi:D-alanine-D-alanine ligase
VSASIRVALLYGGVSGEHEVSINSGRSVGAALTEAGFTVLPVHIDRAGRWLLDGAEVVLRPGGVLMSVAEGACREVARADVVFPVLHGTLGEDGTVQGLLEVLELPYVGSGVLGSALGMDKIVQKRLFVQAGLTTVEFVVTTRRRIETSLKAVMDEVEASVGYPCFVKPANLGSSVGVSKAAGRSELGAALGLAARYDRRVLVERGLVAREIEVGVLGNDEPRASLAGEVLPGREFYDYVAKYGDAGSQTVVPAPIPDALMEEVRQAAVRAFLALDLAGLARVDFLLDRNSGRLYLNEVNTIPGFTNISMYSKLWEASGISFAQLVSQLVELAFERAEDRRHSLAAAREVVVVG